MRKIQELILQPKCVDLFYICRSLSVLSVQTADIVDKVVLSGVVPQLIRLMSFNRQQEVDKEILKVFAIVCGHCSSALIPQLLETDIAQYMINELIICEATRVNESIGGLRGIIRYSRESSNHELFKRYVNAEKLAEKCRELVSGGVSEASELLKDLLWVMSGDKEVKEPEKKHKSYP